MRVAIRTAGDTTALDMRTNLPVKAIPLAARIVAGADVYDALRSRRLHRPALSHPDTVEMMTSSEGQFDPALMPVFKACLDRFEQVFRERP